VENLSDTTYDAVYIGVKGKLAIASAGSKDATTALDDETKRIITQFALASRKP
jgi:hypothetical protein